MELLIRSIFLPFRKDTLQIEIFTGYYDEFWKAIITWCLWKYINYIHHSIHLLQRFCKSGLGIWLPFEGDPVEYSPLASYNLELARYNSNLNLLRYQSICVP